ncbi:24470_t:CDS:1, partial [Dentiscutata erythropus]
PFDGDEFDIGLAVKICQGKRPEFRIKFPTIYDNLAKSCAHSDPSRRPNIAMVISTINDWIQALKASPAENLEETDFYFDVINKAFQDADIINIPVIEQTHPDYMYTSKPINTREIIKAFGIELEKDGTKALEWYLQQYQLQWFSYNQFKDIQEIGQGGYATVFKAKENITNQT